MPSQYTKANIAAENTFSNSVKSAGQRSGEQDIAVSISGTFVATVTVQRSLDDGITFHDLPSSYTVASESNIIPARNVLYRAGVKTGDYTSGTVVIELRG